jgi:hypothetical protein
MKKIAALVFVLTPLFASGQDTKLTCNVSGELRGQTVVQPLSPAQVFVTISEAPFFNIQVEGPQFYTSQAAVIATQGGVAHNFSSQQTYHLYNKSQKGFINEIKIDRATGFISTKSANDAITVSLTGLCSLIPNRNKF